MASLGCVTSPLFSDDTIPADGSRILYSGQKFMSGIDYAYEKAPHSQHLLGAGTKRAVHMVGGA